jgi:hypothetical protein
MKTALLFVLSVLTLMAGPVTVNPTDLTWAPGQWDAVLLEENAGYADQNVLMAMTLDQTTTAVIFEGIVGPISTTTFYMPSTWALMLDSPDGLFSSVAALSADGLPHFYWIEPEAYGEDLWLYGDADWFQGGDGVDMRVQLTPTAETPEPSTVALIGAGLLILGLVGRRFSCGGLD